MAKKAVATFSGDKSANRNYVKCIKMIKSERTGAYAFEEQLVLNEEVAAYFKK